MIDVVFETRGFYCIVHMAHTKCNIRFSVTHVHTERLCKEQRWMLYHSASSKSSKHDAWVYHT